MTDIMTAQLRDERCGMVQRRARDGERIEPFLSHPLRQFRRRHVEATLIITEAARLSRLLPRIVNGARVEPKLAQRKQCVPGKAQPRLMK